ncbi:hypothetical protein [Parasphingopyxis sp.]|uniref:hypothetical protein n=1 Tax=Parasphingopyxis sp. TaxID=1920299 RepID=UPI0026352F56|nr:hypothetical protein [Parasphingopyxis sp.]
MRPIRYLPALLLSCIALPAAAQDMADGPTEMPQGTYMVFADEAGSAFATYNPALAETGVWPLSFFYFQAGTLAGTARMSASPQCDQGIVRGRLTHAMGPDGAVMELPQSAEMPSFSFDRAGGGGDQAIVDFICGSVQDRLIQAQTPVYNSLEATANSYAQLRALGLDGPLAQSLAIRDREAAEPLIGTAVPEALRDQVRALIDPRH